MKNGFKILLIYFFTPLFLSTIFYSLFETNLMLVSCFCYFILLLFFLILARKDINRDFKDFRKHLKIYLFIIIKWVAIGFCLMMLSNYLIQLFIDILPSNEISNREMINNNPILAITYLLLLAPLLEEYVFRYSFRKIKSYYIYTILTSALFGLLHVLSITTLNEIVYFIPYFILGFGFSNIYFKTNNYLAAALGHIIHNTLCVIIIMLF